MRRLARRLGDLEVIKSVELGNGDRQTMLNELLAMKQANPNFRVIDVGATASSWSLKALDAIVDFNEPDAPVDVKYFAANINREADWEPILRHVEEFGKYDFSICTHTLEDLANPQLVCSQLSRISKAGYVAIPSKYREFSRFEAELYGQMYRGYMHHRWIFSIRDNEFIGFPKVNFLEIDKWFDRLEDLAEDKQDLNFTWSERLDLKIVNDDYLGPTPSDVLMYYRRQLFNDDVDRLCGKQFPSPQ